MSEVELSTEPDSSAPKTRFSMPGPIKCKKECFICGRARTTKGDRSLILIAAYDIQNSVWKEANELKDEYMLCKIHGPDENKCTGMITDNFWYHRDCMNFYLTRRVHTQKKTSTDTSPYDAALAQLVSRIDEPLFRDGAIFFVTALRD